MEHIQYYNKTHNKIQVGFLVTVLTSAWYIAETALEEDLGGCLKCK